MTSPVNHIDNSHQAFGIGVAAKKFSDSPIKSFLNIAKSLSEKLLQKFGPQVVSNFKFNLAGLQGIQEPTQNEIDNYLQPLNEFKNNLKNNESVEFVDAYIEATKDYCTNPSSSKQLLRSDAITRDEMKRESHFFADERQSEAGDSVSSGFAEKMSGKQTTPKFHKLNNLFGLNKWFQFDKKYQTEINYYFNAGKDFSDDLNNNSKALSNHLKEAFGNSPSKILHARVAFAAYARGVLSQKNPKLVLGDIEKDIQLKFQNNLQKKEWKTISKELLLKFDGSKEIKFKSELMPASKFSTEFKEGYLGDGSKTIDGHNFLHGVCSSSIQEKKHAVNLWRVQFTPQENTNSNSGLSPEVKKLNTYGFTGLRHGVHDAYGIKNNNARKEANINRVNEFVHAALLTDIHKKGLTFSDLKKIYDTEEKPSPKIYHLNIASVSLVTPSSTELGMMNGQKEAYEACKNERTIEISNPQNPSEKISIRVQPEIMAFNLPVNKWALNFVGQLPVGKGSSDGKSSIYFGSIWKKADAFNSEALKTLIFGKNNEESGIVTQKIKSLRDELKEHGISNDKKIALEKRISSIEQLQGQVLQIYNEKAHHNRKGDPYKLQVRILALAELCDVVPAFNCKSGKDRTGTLHTKVRLFMAKLHANEGKPPPVYEDPLASKNSRKNFLRLFVYGGDREIQKLNTGVSGTKASLPDVYEYFKSYYMNARKTDHEAKALAKVQVLGLSNWVKS